MPRIRRFQSMILAFAMITGVLALAGPANADPVVGTASLTVTNNPAREVIAGAQPVLTFTVNNTGAPGGILPGDTGDSSINLVRIEPDTGNPASMTVVEGAAGGGWTPTKNGNKIDFEGGTIAPGGNFSFTVTANAARTAADEVVTWIVSVSDNGGQSRVRQNAATPGALDTTIKVLNVDSVLATAPAAGGFVEGVADGTATAGQDNVVLSSTVHNFGGADLDVTPTLSSSQVGDTIGAPAPTSATIASAAPNNIRVFDFPVTLSTGTNNRTFTGDASATGADGITETSSNLATQTPAAFDDAANTLVPAAAVSGVVETFALTINKTNIPAVQLDTSSALTFTRGSDSFSAPLGSVTEIGKNSQTVLLTSAPVIIPGAADGFEDGEYDVSLQLSGIDDNGASVARPVSVADKFTIDNLMPAVDINIGAPAGQLDPNGTPVAKNGNTLTFSGTLKESGAEGAPLDPKAVITDCELVIKSLAGVEISRHEVDPANCRNSGNGNITGSTTLPTTAPASGRAVVSVLASDAAGNATPDRIESTSFVLIDNSLPELGSARTGCGPNPVAGCENRQTIRVTLSEPVKGEFLPADFAVAEQLVISATSTCTAATFCDKVTLTIAPPGLPSDDETPAVTYAFVGQAPLRARPTDGPKNNMITPDAVTAADGILPPLPTLASVTQTWVNNSGNSATESYGKQGADNAYYTNLTSPDFNLTGLAADYTGIVAIDTDGSGLYEAGNDQLIASCPAAGDAVTCATTTPLAPNTTYSILVTATDMHGNIAAEGLNNARVETLITDITGPQAIDFTLTARTATVDFTEVVARGRDFSTDWEAFTLKPSGQEQYYVVGNVTGSGALREANIAPSDTTFGSTLDGVRYIYIGPMSGRYRDFAGNRLEDFTV